MARKATSKAASGAGRATKKSTAKSSSRSVARVSSGSRSRSGSQDSGNAGDAFIKLLQSPLVADLVAVAATAALAALAEHGFSSRGANDRHRAGRAVKAAGKAAAAAIGRRLGTEIDEIRKASSASKSGAKA